MHRRGGRFLGAFRYAERYRVDAVHDPNHHAEHEQHAGHKQYAKHKQ